RIEQAVAGCGVVLEHAADLDAAVLRANALAHAGDAVLLSPACASLDMFRNYAHRAEVFTAAARRLPGVTPR
ncbi:MAG: UDP-N-acetylmuramoyl-L-alanine--D-glutamate ligase, partial [Thauera sp.]